MAAHAHDGPHAARSHACLVGMEDHAWVAQSRTLDGVLAREGGSEQLSPVRPWLPESGLRRSATSAAWCRNVSIRSRWRPVNRATMWSRADRTYRVVVQRQECGPGRPAVRILHGSEALLIGYEPRGDSRRVRGQAAHGERRTVAVIVASRDCHDELTGVLQSRQEGARRLRALVAVHPVGLATIEGAAGRRVPHRVAAVVGAQEPSHRTCDSTQPTLGCRVRPRGAHTRRPGPPLRSAADRSQVGWHPVRFRRPV